MPAPRFMAALVLATVAGIWIALMDSSPNFDDSGITVGSLFLAAGISAVIGSRRPWLFALLVGGFVPLIEIPRGGGGAPLFALLFAGIGAGVGYVVAHTLELDS